MTEDMPRPGCYGSPTCHRATQLPCNHCPFEATCGPIAERVAAGLRRQYGIDQLLGQSGRPAAVATSGELPIKAREHLDRIVARGIDLKRAVALGVNPFSSAPPAFMRVAVDCLFAGSFTRDELRAAFTRELGWSDGTALSHVSIATAVLTHSGVAVDKGGRYAMVRGALAA